MATCALEAERTEKVRQLRRGAGIYCEFEEGETLDLGPRRRIEKLDSLEHLRALAGALGSGRRFALEACARLAFEEEQRLHRIYRRASIGRLAKQIVEDLERQRPAVAGDEHMLEKVREVELALAGEAAVVPAPLQHVHREPRRVGELEEEDL